MALITMERHSLNQEDRDKRVNDAVATYNRKSEYALNFSCKKAAIEYLLKNGFKKEVRDHYSKKTVKRTLDAWVQTIRTQTHKHDSYNGFITYSERKGLWQ